MKEKKIRKSVTLYKSQISTIQDMADSLCEGDFGRALRAIVGVWIAEHNGEEKSKK